jgi:protein O-GlcNAc transferase
MHAMSTKFPQSGSQPSAAATLNEAFAAHQAGNLARAEFIYRLILARDKKNYAALHFLGLISLQRGDYATAEQLIGKAVKLNPKYADARCNLGLVLQKLGRYDEALASYDKAVAIEPRYAEAHYNRGIVLKDLGRFEEAIECYDKAVAIKPDYVEAHINRGSALHELKQFDDALASFDKVLAIKPNYAEAYYNRGNALRELRRHEDALASYDQALTLKPNYAEVYSNRGNMLLALRRFAEAFASYERALAIRPDYAEPHANRGNALKGLRLFTDALASYDQALAIKPDYAEVHFNRGLVLYALKRYEEAIASYDKASSIKPDIPNVHGCRLYAKMQICNWTNIEAERFGLVAAAEKAADFPWPFQTLAFLGSPSEQLRSARHFVAATCPPSAKPLWNGERYVHDKIRIAYMSGDFYGHPVGYAVAGMFEEHDRAQFEPVAISLMYREDQIAERIKNAFDIYIDAAERSDLEVADLIRQLEIDILVDLSGFTGGNRIGVFSHRPAPVQVNYLAYPGTMGASYFDYIVADPTVLPEDHRAYYAEQVVWLPGSYHVNDNRRPNPENNPTRSECGLPNNAFVFCSFNNPHKITPEMFDIWMRLLRRVENGALWVLAASPSVLTNLRREAEKRGVAPDRLIVAPRIPFADHLARHRQADLFLDTLPYNAHTTANDALWTGLPVLTCLGESFPGRVGASLLSAIGLPELITRSLDEYEAMALRLAQDPGLLASLRAKLARNRASSPLFNTKRSTRHIEAAYKIMWERHQHGEPATGFTVKPIE